MILVDSSALVGALIPRDGRHRSAGAALATLGKDRLAVPVTILAETMGLIRARLGVDMQRRFWDALSGIDIALLPVDDDVVVEARAIDRLYGDLGFGFADSVLLALCERERCVRIFTFDTRLAAYRPTFAPALELLP